MDYYKMRNQTDPDILLQYLKDNSNLDAKIKKKILEKIKDRNNLRVCGELFRIADEFFDIQKIDHIISRAHSYSLRITIKDLVCVCPDLIHRFGDMLIKHKIVDFMFFDTIFESNNSFVLINYITRYVYQRGTDSIKLEEKSLDKWYWGNVINAICDQPRLFNYLDCFGDFNLYKMYDLYFVSPLIYNRQHDNSPLLRVNCLDVLVCITIFIYCKKHVKSSILDFNIVRIIRKFVE